MQRARPPVRIVIAGGGTGGHISPAIAVIEELRGREVPVRSVWIGSRTGFERATAAEMGIPFHTIHVGKLRRYPSLSTISDTMRIPLGFREGRRHLMRIKPDLIFSTGGYVSVPTVLAAGVLRIPILTHEQTATIGLATKINARFSDIVALSFPDTAHPRTKPSGRVTVTGNPPRSSILNGDPEAARAHFELSSRLPLVYVTGGAQGAHAVNQAVAEALPNLLEHVEIVHQCGPDRINGDYSRLLERRSELPVELKDRYHPVERVGPELKDLYAASTLVIGRAGAGTVTELAALGIPSFLIPLPGAVEQRRNASILADRGGTILLPQEELTPDRLARDIPALAGDPERLKCMGSIAASVAPDDPAAKLVDELLSLLPERD